MYVCGLVWGRLGRVYVCGLVWGGGGQGVCVWPSVGWGWAGCMCVA